MLGRASLNEIDKDEKFTKCSEKNGFYEVQTMSNQGTCRYQIISSCEEAKMFHMVSIIRYVTIPMKRKITQQIYF